MTTDERIDRLTVIVESLAASVVAHDDSIEAHDRQIGNLIAVAEKQQRQFEELRTSVASVTREWQAYLTRLPKN